MALQHFIKSTVSYAILWSARHADLNVTNSSALRKIRLIFSLSQGLVHDQKNHPLTGTQHFTD